MTEDVVADDVCLRTEVDGDDRQMKELVGSNPIEKALTDTSMRIDEQHPALGTRPFAKFIAADMFKQAGLPASGCAEDSGVFQSAEVRDDENLEIERQLYAKPR
jgi:hypothetical protein